MANQLELTLPKLEEITQNIRTAKPLITELTNFVTANDCANVSLAIGGSPIMISAVEEVEEAVQKSAALLINIGTVDKNQEAAMLVGAAAAVKTGIPLVLDPVGAGFTQYRNNLIEKLLTQFPFTVIKGNLAEIAFIGGQITNDQGVDSNLTYSESEGRKLAQVVANKYQTVVIITGEIDIISDGNSTISLHNGVSKLATVSGTGCMLGSLLATGLGGNPREAYLVSMYATALLSIAGEKVAASDQLNTAFRASLVEVISSISTAEILTNLKVNYG